jgi:hypothetical protein
MSRTESDDFTSAGRVTDKHNILQVKVLEKDIQIISVRIHIIACPWLA